MRSITLPTKNIVRIVLVTAGILLVPLVAMQFTNEVVWSLFDFAVMGVLLFATGLLLELAVRKFSDLTYKVIAVIFITGVFLLVWAELAVGIFGTPFAGS